MPKRVNVFLVGPMGAGKTTIGRQLARTLGREFVDADRELERQTGVGIPVIFEVEGEAGFRAREARVIDQLTAREGIVLATGGGAVLRPENRERLGARGFVVFLRAPLEQLVARTARDRNRPLLRTADPAATLAALIAERGPLYEQVADLIVDTGQRTVKSVVREICRRYQQACENSPSS